MITKDLKDVTELDLQNLIENKVLEGKTLEYKQELILFKDAEKKEFLPMYLR